MARDVVRAVLWRLAHDPIFKARWAGDADPVLGPYHLTDEERQALRHAGPSATLAPEAGGTADGVMDRR